MRKAEKVIVTTAVTGSVHVPSQSPHLPLTAEVADSAPAAVEAGSAIVHLHARLPDGRPTADPEVFEEIVEAGLAEPPLLIQGVFGVLGGIGADHANLQHMVNIADKLFGDDYSFSAFAAGRDQFRFGTHSAWLGGHVRVGLEDSLWLGRGRLAETNAQQVEKIRAAVEDLGKEIATPDEARKILALRGSGTR
jgi:uncharacterized protein (DUF849 family)